jgi:hypothetical protein
MQRKLFFTFLVLVTAIVFTILTLNVWNINSKTDNSKVLLGKKTLDDRMLFSQQRFQHEYNFQKNPKTGLIPYEEKEKEYSNALVAKQKEFLKKATSINYISRGPSNYGGRTRSLVIDKSDTSGNTIISGGVSGGVFRTTDGGLNWVKVSANDEIHNVTAIAQDPRPSFYNIWYYATGEYLGNSASLGNSYLGNGIWKSIDNGLSWEQIPETNSNLISFDSYLDYISSIEVNPISGNLIIGALGKVYSFDGNSLSQELISDGFSMTDVVITNSGRVFVAFGGKSNINGVWTSLTGNGNWIQIAQNNSPTNWTSTGRIVLGNSVSNENIIYALYVDENNSNGIEADLWKYDAGLNLWTDYSYKLPDEPDGDISGNDPFAVQGGYDLVVSVKPDNENFVVIGGTNAYKIEDITTESMFSRIGGYATNKNYLLYSADGDEHHSDIHALVFDANNSNVLYSGTDGGIHKTVDVTTETVNWLNLNNNYITYQFYHVAQDSQIGSDLVIGGTQDNGTVFGGTSVGADDKTTMAKFYGGDGVAVGLARNSVGTIVVYAGSQNGNMISNVQVGSIAPEGSSSIFVTYFYLDPDNSEILYYAGLNKLYKTSDAENVTSDTWIDAGLTPTNEYIRSMAATRGDYNPSSSYLLIGGGSGGVFRWDNPKNQTDLSSAVNITPSGASISNGAIVSGLAIHPNNPDIALVVYSNYGINSIYITSNATNNSPNWSLVERNLNNHSIRSAAIADVNGQPFYFVGTARGLYANTDPLNTDWEIQGVNNIGFAVVSSLVLRPSDNKLVIGTHGNGMFDATLESSVLSVEKVNNETDELFIYPNPVSTEIKMSVNFSYQNDSKYSILDINGRSIKSGNINSNTISVEELTAGLYILKLNVNGKRVLKKFIKK